MILRPVLQVKVYDKALEIAAQEVAQGDDEKAKALVDRWSEEAIKALRELGKTAL